MSSFSVHTRYNNAAKCLLFGGLVALGTGFVLKTWYNRSCSKAKNATYLGQNGATQMNKDMYYIPHISLMRSPSLVSYNDDQGRKIRIDQGTPSEVIQKCAQAAKVGPSLCYGVDTAGTVYHDLMIPQSTDLFKYNADPSKGMYMTDQRGFNNFCKGLKGTVQNRQCQLSAAQAQERVKSWNDAAKARMNKTP